MGEPSPGANLAVRFSCMPTLAVGSVINVLSAPVWRYNTRVLPLVASPTQIEVVSTPGKPDAH